MKCIVLVGHDYDNPPRYLCVHEDNSFDVRENPLKATEFPNKKAARDWLHNNMELENHSFVAKDAAVEKFREYIAEGAVESIYPGIDTSISYEYDKDKHTALDILNWHTKIADWGKILPRHDRTWPKLDRIYKNICGVRWEYPDNFSFFIQVSKLDVYEEFKKEVDLALKKSTIKRLYIEGFPFSHHLRKEVKQHWIIDGYEHFGPTTLKRCFEHMRENYSYDRYFDED